MMVVVVCMVMVTVVCTVMNMMMAMCMVMVYGDEHGDGAVYGDGVVTDLCS